MRELRYFLGTVAAAGAVVFMALQMVPNEYGRPNPPVHMEPLWDSADTRTLARRACFDCHSNETEWPGYARVAPLSWLVQRDVEAGRAALNFSEWNRPQAEAARAAAAVRHGEMPVRVYALMHAHARLTAAERAALVRGLQGTLGTARRHDALAR